MRIEETTAVQTAILHYPSIDESLLYINTSSAIHADSIDFVLPEIAVFSVNMLPTSVYHRTKDMRVRVR